MNDLRSFLRDWEAKHPSDVCRIKRPVSVKHEVTALAAKLEKNDLYPALLLEKPITAQGKESSFPVITNLLAGRRRCAAAVGISPREVAQGFASKTSRRIPPEVVSPKLAPVKAVIKKGSDINLYELPVLVHHEGTSGPRFTAAMATTVDPATGIDNCALQSATIRGRDKLSWANNSTAHNTLNMKAWWSKGEDCPVAFWIGHHPASSLGGQQILSHPESHYPGIGGLFGEPLRLVPTETFGEKLLVPADAEIVIEGYAPKDGWGSGAYAGDHAKTMIPMGPAPTVRITAITHRKDAFYHDIAVGHADNLVMGGFAIEAAVYQACKKVSPSVQNVHLPLSGLCRRIVNVQVKNPTAGEVRAIICTALTVDTRVKYIYVVDDDVDIFDDREITLALVNRAQIDRDLLIIPGLPDTAIDPVAVHMADGYVTAKAGFDLTLPPSPLPGFPKQFEAGIKFPREVEEKLRIEDYLSVDDLRKLEKEDQ